MINFPEIEKKALKVWRDKKIFKKSLEKTKKGKPFVFFEGPPTANGKPGIHHVLARAFKDVIPRFKTMQGFFVERKAGWDTHGLPVELEVEKSLKISGKPEIEKYGIEEFNDQCRSSVWKYKKDWEEMTERLGFWIDMEKPYVTYDDNYIESVWWILKQVWDKKLLYKGHKVVPQCPRCGTSLSSHEVALGYKEISEDSVYIKFELVDEPKTYVLAWTTTPWTLPGNVALAINKDIDYIKTAPNEEGERFILAKSLVDKVIGPSAYKIVDNKVAKIFKGEELIGKSYKPLFDFLDLEKETGKKAYYISDADFVNLEEGTGIVHTAVMYGEDDYNLGEKIGLPKKHTLDENGIFNDLVKPWKGKFVKDKQVEKEIVKYLKNNKLLYKIESYSHDYPFCWRCDSPLLYYAKNSWFIKMSSLREELKKNNEDITWVPDYIKHGRFGEWINEVKDWAISRERYWGTPLPIWQCGKCQEYKCIGSREELKNDTDKKITKLIFVRHGESEKNAQDIRSRAADKFPLTEKGRKETEQLTKKITEEVDLIISSSVLRAKQTAEILQKKLNVDVVYDDLIDEYNSGNWEDISREELEKKENFKEYNKIKSDPEKKYNFRLGKTGETRAEIVKRVEKFIDKIAKKYTGKNIIIVSHAGINAAIDKTLNDISLEQFLAGEYIDYYGILQYFYLNEKGESLDLHRPYVDEIELPCECGGVMKRIPDVIDCWFDSGAMPFAQYHYPFENKDRIDGGSNFPADYISEAMDQTRGWFYTLLAISTLLSKGTSYKNVICLGLVLDAKGQKMSKSKGNIVVPEKIFEKFGADAIRWYFFVLNQPGETKLFDEKGVEEVVKKRFLILTNVLSFYKMYAEKKVKEVKSDHVLDRWIFTQLNILKKEVTEELENYQVVNAARKISGFITDLSTWYLRRSRARFKSEDKQDRERALYCLYSTLLDLCKIMAPFTPFVSEYVYSELKGEKESVHLEDWPDMGEIEEDRNVEDMAQVRRIVEIGHAVRAENTMKVRQPLSQLISTASELSDEHLEIIKEELNVKEVHLGKTKQTDASFKSKEENDIWVGLDLTITDELKEEGMFREAVRQINSLRKEAKLTIKDRVKLSYYTEDELLSGLFAEYGESLKKEALLTELKKQDKKKEGGFDFCKTIKIDKKELFIGIKK